MEERQPALIAGELELKPCQVEAVGHLLEDGATIPFIARYRKEATGSLDEVAVTAVRDRSARLQELDQRRQAIVKSLTERGLLTDELKEGIQRAETLSALEDLYLPFRPKRRTRGSVAKERGLEPLAALFFEQNSSSLDPETEAVAYLDPDKGVASVADALAGARDIMAEWMSENFDEICVTEAEPGDILTFRMFSHQEYAQHCAFLATPETLLHTYEGIGGTSEVSFVRWWRRRTACAYRLKGVT